MYNNLDFVCRSPEEEKCVECETNLMNTLTISEMKLTKIMNSNMTRKCDKRNLIGSCL